MKRRNNFYIITSIYTGTLIISNILANKIIMVMGMVLPCAIIVFPLVYILSDLITEVYGIRLSLKAIQTNLWMNMIMSIIFIIAINIPPAPFYEYNDSYIHVLGSTNRVIVASIIAYFFGDLFNSLVLSFMKSKFHNKNTIFNRFYIRSIASSLVGQLFDTAVFIIISFIGLIPISIVFQMIFFQYIVKIVYEIICLPLTVIIIKKWKEFEHIDHIDRW